MTSHAAARLRVHVANLVTGDLSFCVCQNDLEVAALAADGCAVCKSMNTNVLPSESDWIGVCGFPTHLGL